MAKRALTLVPACSEGGPGDALNARLEVSGASLADLLAALDAARAAIADGAVIGFEREPGREFAFFVEPVAG